MNSRIKDISGNIYGYLEAIVFVKVHAGNAVWKCRCVCGNYKQTEARRLKNGAIKSCGCLVKRRKDINIGKTFNNWTVMKEGNKGDYYILKCNCGALKERSLQSIKSGKSKSCGNHPRIMSANSNGFLKIINKSDKMGYWNCSCICGKTVILTSHMLSRKKTCGCGIRKDLSNKKFGNLTVERFSHKVNKRNFWLCLCYCGNESKVTSSNLLSGRTKSCGCRVKIYTENKNIELLKYLKDQNMWEFRCIHCKSIGKVKRKGIKNIKSCGCARRKDISNIKFGKLLAKSYSHTKYGNAYWLCKCDCGNVTTVQLPHLQNNVTKSCGCQHLISQFKLYKIIKELYKDYNVISNYKPKILYNKETKGTQHIDIAVLKNDKIVLAIEYDGRQHFRPVRFGGISEAKAKQKYQYQITLDDRKNKILKNHNIRLIRFKYNDNINRLSVTRRCRG